MSTDNTLNTYKLDEQAGMHAGPARTMTGPHGDQALAAPRPPRRRGARQAVRVAGAHKLVGGAAQLVQVLVGRLEHAAADATRKRILVDVVHRDLASGTARLSR
jgi:hypothetical protein